MSGIIIVSANHECLTGVVNHLTFKYVDKRRQWSGGDHQGKGTILLNQFRGIDMGQLQQVASKLESTNVQTRQTTLPQL